MWWGYLKDCDLLGFAGQLRGSKRWTMGGLSQNTAGGTRTPTRGCVETARGSGKTPLRPRPDKRREAGRRQLQPERAVHGKRAALSGRSHRRLCSGRVAQRTPFTEGPCFTCSAECHMPSWADGHGPCLCHGCLLF